MKNDEIREVVDTLARFCIYFFVVIGVQLIIVFGFDDGMRDISNSFVFVALVSMFLSAYFCGQSFLIEGLTKYIDEIERLKTIKQECVSFTGYIKKESGLHIRIGVKIYSYFREKDRKKLIKKIPRAIKRLEGQSLKAEKAYIFWKNLFDKTDIRNFLPIRN